MISDQLRLAQQAVPFQPFTIHLPNGRQLHGPHRDFISVSPTGRMATVYREDGAASIIEVRLMTGLEMHRTDASGPQPNGS